jgi:uncharacterized protein
MMRHRFWFQILMISGSLCLFAIMGCVGSTPPSKFYLLNSINTGGSVSAVSQEGSGPVVGIGPVTIPDHLDRPQIVVRPSPNKLELADFDKWAGSLKSNIERVVAENLSVLLNTDRVFIYPWGESVPTNYQVALAVVRFDGIIGGQVELKARWTLSSGDEQNVVVIKQSRFSESVDGSGYDAFVAAQSRALEALSREIAETIIEDLK